MPSRKLLIVFGSSLLLIFTTLALMHHDRDRQSRFLERLDPNTYITSDLASIAYMKSFTESPQVFTKFFEASAKNECLNGKNPSKMGPKEQLLEFIKGPCLPAIAIPGILASRLTVKIDCPTFKEHNPDIFEKCGWSTCDSWKIWASKPKDQYVLWISNFMGPLSVIFQDSVRCWGNIIQLNYNASEPDITKKYLSPVGVNISVYGHNDGEESRCGFGAITDILPSPYQTMYSKGYKIIEEGLVKMGYQVGLSLYAMPYDWRKTTVANGITDALKRTVVQIYELTGKPTVIMAHSLGNFGALHLLNSLTEEEKEKYIANYVSITNPLAGSPKVLKTFVGGDKEYVYKKFGINYYAQRKLVQASSGPFDLVPKDIYDFYANSTWLQEWKLRADMEKHHNVTTLEGRNVWEEAVRTGNYTYKWFPTPLLNCSSGFEQRRDECGLYMYNWSAQPLAIIMNESFTACETSIKRLFNEYALSTNVSDYIFEDIKSNEIYELRNPGVPVTLIYGSHLWTDMTYKWDYDPRDSARNDEFAFANVTYYSQGDQTVPTSSALLPALKWSWEFDNPERAGIKNPKPVKTVEICSIHNNKRTIYDGVGEDGRLEVQGNEYIGLECDCFGTNNTHPVVGQSCDHGDILADSKLVEFVLKIVNANFTITNTSDLVINQLTDDELKIISQNCPSVVTDFEALHTVMGDKQKQNEQKVETIEV